MAFQLSKRLPVEQHHRLHHGRVVLRRAHLAHEVGNRHGGDWAQEARVVVVRQERGLGGGQRGKAEHALILVVVGPAIDGVLVDDVDHRRGQVRADEAIDLVAVDASGVVHEPVVV